MNKKRGFKIVSKYLNQGLNKPKRATEGSAGYDFSSAVDITIPSIWKQSKEASDVLASTLVATGIKAYMPANEYLMLVNRSSNPLKRNLTLPNGIGIIDSDYYDNPNNEGEIFVQLINYGLKDYEIKKGERIAQGIFSNYHTVDDEEKNQNKRIGGFGSTGEQ